MHPLIYQNIQMRATLNLAFSLPSKLYVACVVVIAVPIWFPLPFWKTQYSSLMVITSHDIWSEYYFFHNDTKFPDIPVIRISWKFSRCVLINDDSYENSRVDRISRNRSAVIGMLFFYLLPKCKFVDFTYMFSRARRLSN